MGYFDEVETYYNELVSLKTRGVKTTLDVEGRGMKVDPFEAFNSGYVWMDNYCKKVGALDFVTTLTKGGADANQIEYCKSLLCSLKCNNNEWNDVKVVISSTFNSIYYFNKQILTMLNSLASTAKDGNVKNLSKELIEDKLRSLLELLVYLQARVQDTSNTLGDYSFNFVKQQDIISDINNIFYSEYRFNIKAQSNMLNYTTELQNKIDKYNRKVKLLAGVVGVTIVATTLAIKFGLLPPTIITLYICHGAATVVAIATNHLIDTCKELTALKVEMAKAIEGKEQIQSAQIEIINGILAVKAAYNNATYIDNYSAMVKRPWRALNSDLTELLNHMKVGQLDFVKLAESLEYAHKAWSIITASCNKLTTIEEYKIIETDIDISALTTVEGYQSFVKEQILKTA